MRLAGSPRRFAALILALLTLGASVAHAQDFPTRPLRLVVAFAPGGTTDLVARMLAERVSVTLRQPVVVENRPGANGAIAAEFIAKSDADGHSLFFTTMGAIAINPNLRTDLPYDPVKDFAPVALLARNTTVLAVSPALGLRDVADLVALAKQKPGAVTMAITGVGANSHLALELFQSAAGIKFQYIPYRGAALAMTDILAGQVNGIFADVPVMLAQLAAGKIKALGITSAARFDLLPDVPTLIELGYPDTIAENWQGVLAPAGTPPAVIERLNAAFVGAIEDTQVRHKLVDNGVTPLQSSPGEFSRLIVDEIARWGRIIREKNIKPAT